MLAIWYTAMSSLIIFSYSNPIFLESSCAILGKLDGLARSSGAAMNGCRMRLLRFWLRPLMNSTSKFGIFFPRAIKKKNICRAEMSHDVWQYGIVVFVCLTGCLPWQKAAPDDPRYVSYCHWHGSNGVMMQVILGGVHKLREAFFSILLDFPHFFTIFFFQF